MRAAYRDGTLEMWGAAINCVGVQQHGDYRLLHAAYLIEAAPKWSGVPVVLGGHKRPFDIVGVVGRAKLSDPLVIADVKIWDRRAIEKIVDGPAAFSVGYGKWSKQMVPGRFRGENFDGRITKMAGDHVAIVDVGRAGDAVRIRLPEHVREAIIEFEARRLANLFRRIRKKTPAMDAPRGNGMSAGRSGVKFPPSTEISGRCSLVRFGQTRSRP